MLGADRRREWDERGYTVLRGFASPARVRAMLDRIVELVRTADAGGDVADALVLPEPALAHRRAPEERVSKVFRVHRHEPVFRDFSREPRLLDAVGEILGPDLDCFLSQFIFKRPGSLGQPWHQDAFYFPFDRGPQVGAWLACTEATRDNGPLHVLPGSHREPVHDVVPDRREGAPFSYVEIVDHDTDAAVPVLMAPGDLLLFHSHLMHRSTDNRSERMRAAMVYHYAQAGTEDRSEARFGFRPPNVDWVAVRRA